MRRFLEKYKMQYDVFSVLVFASGSVLFFIEYPEEEHKIMKLFSAIVFGIMAIIKTSDVIETYQGKKKPERLNSPVI